MGIFTGIAKGAVGFSKGLVSLARPIGKKAFKGSINAAERIVISGGRGGKTVGKALLKTGSGEGFFGHILHGVGGLAINHPIGAIGTVLVGGLAAGAAYQLAPNISTSNRNNKEVVARQIYDAVQKGGGLQYGPYGHMTRQDMQSIMNASRMRSMGINYGNSAGIGLATHYGGGTLRGIR